MISKRKRKILKRITNICRGNRIRFAIDALHTAGQIDVFDIKVAGKMRTVKEIVLGQKLLHTNLYRPRDVVKVFCHEFAHYLQYEEGVRRPESYEELLAFERTAERRAYFVARKYFPTYRIHHAEFSAYKSKKDKEFLKEQCKEQEKKEASEKRCAACKDPLSKADLVLYSIFEGDDNNKLPGKMYCWECREELKEERVNFPKKGRNR